MPKHVFKHGSLQDMLDTWSSNNTGGMPFQREFPRTVWLLWLDGWNTAPWMVREVAHSFERHNPGWDIICLDNDNLRQYIDVEYIDNPHIESAAKSDIVRLSILAEHGGIWADATILCFAPLDSWMHEALMPVEFWMYHGRDNGDGPASWFIASTNQSYIIQKWKQAADQYWIGRTKMHDYFWMDILFRELMDSDSVFLRTWQQVPYLYCEAQGQAAMLDSKVQGDSAHIKQQLDSNPPYVLKLSFHKFPDETLVSTQTTNGYYAIKLSYRRRPVYHSLRHTQS